MDLYHFQEKEEKKKETAHTWREVSSCVQETGSNDISRNSSKGTFGGTGSFSQLKAARTRILSLYA